LRSCSAAGCTALGITLATAAVAYSTRFNPLWLFAAAVCHGYLGPCEDCVSATASNRGKIFPR
jgi:hypothetical protein